MTSRTTLAALAATAALALSHAASPAAARSCRNATINGATKCLQAGEFCTHAYDHSAPRHWPYTHYGFRCVKFYANVDRYRLTYAH
jgi:hypothetical protein